MLSWMLKQTLFKFQKVNLKWNFEQITINGLILNWIENTDHFETVKFQGLTEYQNENLFLWPIGKSSNRKLLLSF